MSIEQAPLHTIRMETKDWNELLITAVNAGYKSRAEYIRANLKGERLWSSEQPPTEIQRATPILIQDLEVETLRQELSARQAEIARLQSKLQDAELHPSTVTHSPIVEKKPVHRFSLASIQKRWPETQRNRYSKLGWKPDEWMKIVLETAYDMLDELT